MKIRKLVSTAATALLMTASINANAHTSMDEQCNIQLNGNLKYENNVLTVISEDGQQFEFIAGGNVYLNGEILSLTPAQTQYAQDYYQHIQKSIPVTMEVAKEAVALANTAVVEVFGELLGHDNELTQEFGQFFDQVNYDIENKFYTENGAFFIQTDGLDDGQWVDQAWEQEFEEKIESLIAKSMGRLLIALGTEMLWGDGDSSDFEARMTKFGDDLEQRLSHRGEALGVKAQQLCVTLRSADEAETALASEVDALRTLDLLNVEVEGHRM